MGLTRNSKVTQPFIGVLVVQEVVDDIDVEEFPTDDWGSFLELEVVECSGKLQWFWIRGFASFTVPMLARRWKNRHV